MMSISDNGEQGRDKGGTTRTKADRGSYSKSTPMSNEESIQRDDNEARGDGPRMFRKVIQEGRFRKQSRVEGVVQ